MTSYFENEPPRGVGGGGGGGAERGTLSLFIESRICVSNLQVSNSDSFFSWMAVEFVPGIYAGTWYNGADEKLEEYIGNKWSLLVGLPRLRQLRVREGKSIQCDIIPFRLNYFLFSFCFISIQYTT